MSISAGDTLRIDFDHDTEGTFGFECKAAEDVEIDHGGVKVADESDSVGANGTPIFKLNRSMATVSLSLLYDMRDSGNVLLKMRAINASAKMARITISHISGAYFGGLGMPVGDLKGNLNTGIAQIKYNFQSLEPLN